jgi:peptidoglycan/xylan/chitin deacetylase (PgdA/CDA1 family)
MIHPNARKSPRTLFLVWHDIIQSEKLVWFDTTLTEFQKQLTALEKAQVHPVALPQIERWLITGQNPPPKNSVVLCFDDNTQGIFDFVLPELQKRGWPFVVSAHTAFVGVKTGKEHCDWDDLKVMARSGGTIVSQTHSHPPDLRTFSEAKLTKEFSLSKVSMAKRLGITPRYVTYPSGKWDARVAQAAQSAGYKLSPHCLGINRYSTHRRWSEALAILQAK